MDIRGHILSLALKQGKVRSQHLAIQLGVSRQYAQRMIRDLVKEGMLVKLGSTRAASYVLPKDAEAAGWNFRKRLRNKGLEEHAVLEDIEGRAQFAASLPENVRSIFEYAFSEMLNNAIDHSRSGTVTISVEKNKDLLFHVDDVGIGVFRNIRQKRGLKSELEAVQDLLKGKTTTQPRAHSGEGIFFTSKIADVFTLESFGYKLTIDNLVKDVFFQETKPSRKGTKVTFRIATGSGKHLNDVFRGYQTDPGEHAFDKTEIQVRLYTMGTIHISRSQARRVLSGLEKFKSVILDFDQVPNVGQAFADEIFRVFRQKHPHIQIHPVNMNKAVEFMVGRVGK